MPGTDITSSVTSIDARAPAMSTFGCKSGTLSASREPSPSLSRSRGSATWMHSAQRADSPVLCPRRSLPILAWPTLHRPIGSHCSREKLSVKLCSTLNLNLKMIPECPVTLLKQEGGEEGEGGDGMSGEKGGERRDRIGEKEDWEGGEGRRGRTSTRA